LIAAGRPRFGHISYCKQDAHYKYKIAVKDAVDTSEDRFNEDMLDCYVRKDNKLFELCIGNKFSNFLGSSHV